MYLGTMEALKSAVASNLGMSIVPEMAVAKPVPEIVVRPLRPLLSRTLALIEHRNKPNEPALEIVRTALLGLRASAAAANGRARGPSKRGSSRASHEDLRRPRGSSPRREAGNTEATRDRP
jgi:hypothetical protein